MRTKEERENIRIERKRKLQAKAVHRALGCDWVYLGWQEFSSGPAIRVPSRSPGDASFRICPICGARQQTTLEHSKIWKTPHVAKTRYYWDGLRIAKEFVEKEERERNAQKHS